jgi:hypothetical protein
VFLIYGVHLTILSINKTLTKSNNFYSLLLFLMFLFPFIINMVTRHAGITCHMQLCVLQLRVQLCSLPLYPGVRARQNEIFI